MKDQSVARRRQMIYGAQEVSGGRSSSHSLASNMTGASSNSWGSASTVTQDSYARSRQSGERKKKTRKRSDGGERKMARRMSEVIDLGKDVDVFEFLVEEEEEPESPQMESPGSTYRTIGIPVPDTYDTKGSETASAIETSTTHTDTNESHHNKVPGATEAKTKTPEMQSRRVPSPWITALKSGVTSSDPIVVDSSGSDISASEEPNVILPTEDVPDQAIAIIDRPEPTDHINEDVGVEHESAHGIDTDQHEQCVPSVEKIDERLPVIEAQLVELTKSHSLDDQIHTLDILSMELARLSALRSDTPSQVEHNIKMPNPGLQRRSNVSSPYQQQDMMGHVNQYSLQKYHPNKLSDSGISMGSEVGEPHPGLFPVHPLPPLAEEGVDYPHYNEYQTYVPSIVEPYYHHEPQMWNHLTGFRYTPEPPMPLSPESVKNQPFSHNPLDYAYRGTPEPPSTEETSREVSVACVESTPLVFQDKSETSPPHPMLFRSFANVNARVLLQMQSNITDLEQELLALDAKIGSAEQSSGHRRESHGKSSRRFSKDQARRADLYQELNTSLQQYYESLSSFNQISQITTPSKSEDSSILKSWLQSNLMSSAKIASLTGDGGDLVRLDRPLNEVSEETLRVVAYCVFTNVFLPLILFKLSSSVLSRLILLSLTTTFAALAMDRHRSATNVELGNLYSQCIVGCVGFCSIVAFLF